MSDVSEISIWRVLVAIPVGFVAGIAGLVLSGIVVANIPVFQRIPVIIGVGLVLAVFFTCAGAAALPVLRFRRSKPPAKPAFMDLDESEEREFAAACALLKTSASKSLVNGWLMLVVSAVAFVIWVRMGQNWQVASILFGVVLLHEAGHLAAMRVLGYRDTRILFLPFFGALTSGTSPNPAAWKKCLVTLMGPAPGLIAGGALVLCSPPGLLKAIGTCLVLVNGLNLLPIAPLDGAALLNLTVFSRRPWLEAAGQVVMGAGMLVFAISQSDWTLLVVGGFVLGMIPLQHRLAKAAIGLRERGVELPISIEQADADQLRLLWMVSRRTVLTARAVQPKTVVGMMRQVHQRVVDRPAALLASALFLLAHAGLAVFAAGIVVILHG